MFPISRLVTPGIRWFATTSKKAPQTAEAVKTTVDTGKELEERVARMLRKRGHINIKMNQRVRDRNGNLSEFDIVYGWPIKHYVECKNYSHPVKLEMVAKFKEVLRLHRIPRSHGLFVTTSTYTPRATTIGITCIDGAGLERLEKTATTSLLIKLFIVLICAGGSYALYEFLVRSDTPKVKKWRDDINAKNQEILEKSALKITKKKSKEVPIVNKVETSVSKPVSKPIPKPEKIVAEAPRIVKSKEVHSKNHEEEEYWNSPSIFTILSKVFWSVFGY